MSTIYKILTFFLMLQILVVGFSFKINAEENFETWLSSYKKFALKKGVSQEHYRYRIQECKIFRTSN